MYLYSSLSDPNWISPVLPLINLYLSSIYTNNNEPHLYTNIN